MAILINSGTPKDEKNRWGTLIECFNDGQYLYGRPFEIDVCAEPETAKVNRFMVAPEWFEARRLSSFGVGDHKGFNLKPEQSIVGFDALQCDWGPNWWCNPPFDLKAEFIAKATEEVRKGNPGMMLIPYEPLTAWWRNTIEGVATRIYEPDGRYNFYEIDGETRKSGVNFGCAFVLFTPEGPTTPRQPFRRGIALNAFTC
ncbi:DNA N-6-adenine-methyltransferase [Vibrio phage 1.205.O._10N.222.51.A7]|nr:DNA N-6-adenine-methyltransferase [Vibrio phage 1.205.O._10N.222.51.A7]